MRAERMSHKMVKYPRMGCDPIKKSFCYEQRLAMLRATHRRLLTPKTPRIAPGRAPISPNRT
eukprot:UN14699